MLPRPTFRLSWIAGVALCAVAAPRASAGPRAGGASPAVAAAGEHGCVPAAIADVKLPAEVEVDEIRVIVKGSSPDAGAATVRVDGGLFDRVVRVRGSMSKILKFSPALSSQAFRVSLSPVLAAERDACVERIELVRSGLPVATVRP